MTEPNLTELLKGFVARSNEAAVRSTDSRVIYYDDPLYNVEGSTWDPKEVDGFEGLSWTKLLLEHAGLEGASCYVTNATAPTESSHPGFNVGGHMTPNSDGHVSEGEICYLMPLCKWHNSTSRDGVAFEHSETKMLILSGYMLGEPALTFNMRLPSPDTEPFDLIYQDQDSNLWRHKNISVSEALNINHQNTGHHVLIEKPQLTNGSFKVKDVDLPD